MSRHEGVSCDCCLRNNFKGRRYKCLVCVDYDVCENCFQSGLVCAQHVSSHAMQCMLPRAEYELYYAGESASLTTDAPLALTCPYCGRMGFTESSLYEHACREHSEIAVEVICPFCATQPGGEPNNLVLDFVAHIQQEHRTSAVAAGAGGGDEGHAHHMAAGHHGVAPGSHSAVLQMQQTAAQQQNGTSGQHDLRQQPRRMPSRGASAGGGSGGSLGTRTSRRHPQMAFAAMPLSPRDSAMESITELLSQLSGTRRAVNAAATAQTAHNTVPSAQQTIQQLHMQLERQHTALSRQQLTEKLPRRTGALLDVAGAAGGSGLLPPHQGSTLAGGHDGSQAGGLGTIAGQSQYLLARYLNDDGDGNALNGQVSQASAADAAADPATATEPSGPDRAQFVENLLLNSLLPNSALWKLHCATANSSQRRSVPSSRSVPGHSNSSSSSSNNNNNNNNNNNSSTAGTATTTSSVGRAKYSQSRSSGPEDRLSSQENNAASRRPRSQQQQAASSAEQANTTDDSSIADDEDEWNALLAAEAAAVWDSNDQAAARGRGAAPPQPGRPVGAPDAVGTGPRASSQSTAHNRPAQQQQQQQQQQQDGGGDEAPPGGYPRR